MSSRDIFTQKNYNKADAQSRMSWIKYVHKAKL